MEFLKIWEIMLRRRKLVIITFSIIFGTMVIVTHLVTPSYEARAKLLIESSSTLSSLMSSLGVTSVGKGFTSSNDDTYTTNIALATIRPLLEKLISELNLKDRDGEKIKPDDVADAGLSHLLLPQPCLEVALYEETDMLEIVAYSTDPKQAADIANKLAEFYIEDMLNRTREEYRAARMFIGSQINKVREEYYTSLADLKDFKVREGTVDLGLETHNLVDKISVLRNSYDANEENIFTLEKETAEAKDKLANMERYRTESKEFSQNDQLKNLKLKLSDILIGIAEKSIDFSDEHPEYRLLEKEMETVRELIKKEADMLFTREMLSIDPVYDVLYRKSIEGDLDREVALAKRGLLKKFLDKYQGELLTLPVRSAESSKLELALSVKKDLYQKLLEYMTQVEIAESMTISNIRTVEPAVTPEKTYFPNTPLNYVLGVFFGLFWGLMLALFVEYIDNTVKSPEDLKHIKSPTLLGNIPKAKQLQNMNLISSLPPNSPIVEAYRTIRNSIRYAAIDKQIKTLVVTSSIEAEGKSSLASNISIALSMEGKRVILVDLDLRRPSIYKFFNVSNKAGVTSVLTEDLSLQETIASTTIKGVDVLTSGPIPPDPSALIESEKLKNIICRLKEMYDMVIIDTPPVLAVNDASVIGASADGIIFAVEAGRATFSMLEHVKELKNKAGFNVVGVVLNKFSAHASGYYHYYYYNSYYKK